MSVGYSDTTHGRFIEHMDLARAWAQRNGQRVADAQVLRVMRRLDADILRRLLEAQDDEPPTRARRLTRQERLEAAADAGYDTWDEYRDYTG